MALLTWDQTGEKLYETGVQKCVLYPLASDGTYSAGYAWNGVTAVTESPSGAEKTALYADDKKYLELMSAEEFGATIEAYMFPEEFAQCDGSATLTDGVTIGQQSRKTFGLCYRTTVGNDVDGNDHGYKLHFIYGAMASPSEKAYSTINDSPEAITFSWEVTTTPVPVSGNKPTASLIVDSATADADKLAALETIIYGRDAAEASGTEGQPEYTAAVEALVPRMPLPDEVLTLMTPAAEG